MDIKPHPTTGKAVWQLFWKSFLALMVLFALAIFGDKVIPDYSTNHLFLVFFVSIWVVAIHLFVRVWQILKHVDCPNCHAKTETQRSRPELPDNYSAYCKGCNILWDLGVGNTSD